MLNGQSFIVIIKKIKCLTSLLSCWLSKRAEFPLRFALRVLDVVMSERSYIIVMKVAIALLNEAAFSVLAIDDFEKVVSYLRNDLAQIDLDNLHSHMDMALKVRFF